jgi:hypothetical protein
MLDYAANGSAFWAPERLRAWYDGDDPEAAAERLAAWLGSADVDSPEEVAARFWDAGQLAMAGLPWPCEGRARPQ